jgi:hypothetical protein
MTNFSTVFHSYLLICKVQNHVAYVTVVLLGVKKKIHGELCWSYTQNVPAFDSRNKTMVQHFFEGFSSHAILKSLFD